MTKHLPVNGKQIHEVIVCGNFMMDKDELNSEQ